MAESCEAVQRRAQEAARAGRRDHSRKLRELDARQRQALALFEVQRYVTAPEIAGLLGVSPRMGRHVCQQWVEAGFLTTANPAKKSRKYALASRWQT